MEERIEVSFDRSFLKTLEKNIRLEISSIKQKIESDEVEIEEYNQLILQKEKDRVAYDLRVKALSSSLQEIENKIYAKGAFENNG